MILVNHYAIQPLIPKNDLHKTFLGQNHGVSVRDLSLRSFFRFILHFPSAILCCISAQTLPLVHDCGSAFEPGASGLPYYFTPLVCVSAVLGALAVWRHDNQTSKDKPSGRPGGAPAGPAALPGFPITAHHLCAFLLYLEG